MKTQVKKFGQFINEMHDHKDSIKRHSHNSGNLVATVELSRGMGGEFGTIIFGEDKREVDEMESLRATWQNILDIAKSMGADLIYSVEDEAIISQEDIDSLDDQPSGW